ncbi:uracil-DNA glycosylase family protein [Oceanobacter sp. 4_MG-2023]|uniref:uracil-DNA glycosylase family protein n=1 Tax=Oceanobacter sp. 4_MG-2023 TaxID=3062623 RepID=UPI0027346FE7|nr:uracil-DNA glycosylase family protein [Oceanobacter sp. 4_MG-2023]MDP2546561.1 uracil-DNA glycosylase family protein [Oceanobacter sp. 4_MG-2023]
MTTHSNTQTPTSPARQNPQERMSTDQTLTPEPSAPLLVQRLPDLLQQVRQCQLCAAHLPCPPRPIIQISASARLLIIGQAPGSKVQVSGIPWDDASGKRLREWLQLTPEQFYNEEKIAIVPVGLCYPGKGKSGDLPPRAECAPRWHADLLARMPELQLILLIGQYAQNYYLPKAFLRQYKTLTERVKHCQDVPEPFFVLPHPSPRNRHWLSKNPWFEAQTIPTLRRQLDTLLF